MTEPRGATRAREDDSGRAGRGLLKVYWFGAALIALVYLGAAVACVRSVEEAGALGDTFGPITGLATVGALILGLVTLALQREELRLQREEMRAARREMFAQRRQMKRTAKAQEGLASSQSQLADAQETADDLAKRAIRLERSTAQR